jgi:hypothetical protein
MEVISASLATGCSRLLQADSRQAAVNKIKNLRVITKKGRQNLGLIDIALLKSMISPIGNNINSLNALPITIAHYSFFSKPPEDW